MKNPYTLRIKVLATALALFSVSAWYLFNEYEGNPQYAFAALLATTVAVVVFAVLLFCLYKWLHLRRKQKDTAPLRAGEIDFDPGL